MTQDRSLLAPVETAAPSILSREMWLWSARDRAANITDSHSSTSSLGSNTYVSHSSPQRHTTCNTSFHSSSVRKGRAKSSDNERNAGEDEDEDGELGGEADGVESCSGPNHLLASAYRADTHL